MKKLSVIIPAYNEAGTIADVIRKVKNAKLENISKEIIIVDDASTDGTEKILAKIKDPSIKIIRHKNNLGKGAAIRTALKHVTGDMVIVQDADLEYNPNEYQSLLQPIIEKKAKVVYGSRLLGKKKSRYSKWAYYIAGRSLTFITNTLYGTKITDEPCGYKVFDTKTIKSIKLECNRFEFCPEITAKIAKNKIPIYEVPASYNPRSREEGKKIRFRDWLEAVYTLIKYRFFD
ncbi:MAG: glycosyltransferase family 2 protein [Nanoarchaeota archaeon]